MSHNNYATNSWGIIYETMRDVETTQSYYPEYDTFTKWVKSYAKEMSVNISLLWNRYKAGKIYSAYLERARKRDIFPPAVTEVKISPDNLITIDKIARDDTDYADELIEGVLSGNITRSNLNAMWKNKKTCGSASTLRDLRFEDVFLKQLNTPHWLQEHTKNERFKIKYRLIIGEAKDYELPIVIENITSDEVNKFHFHVFEPPTSWPIFKDFLSLEEYNGIVNYRWCVIPTGTDESEWDIPKGCGIITVSKDTPARIIRFAELNSEANCQKITAYALRKLL